MEWGEADAPNETVFSLLPRAGLLQTRVKGDGNDFRTLKLSSHRCFVCLFEPSLSFNVYLNSNVNAVVAVDAAVVWVLLLMIDISTLGCGNNMLFKKHNNTEKLFI